ncbi:MULTISPECIES: ABC-three component system protein [unclassified Rathayibacter]|uniref:ABC-three component system protein n=1 Tax=unclassified Rathayibacter TaxID=2609250 RepID=UPI0011B083CC|nr:MULTISPECIES: ABC-three component system protein [unclassified Rathayibacter]
MVNHDAAPSALGYLHQVDWALLNMLKSGPDRPDQMMMLEQFDDVSWQDDAGPTELLQVKHHINKGSLSDRSVDLWRSIRVWLDDAVMRDIDGPMLCLVTTATAAPASAASLLKVDGNRNETRALDLLDDAARSSQSQDTKAARQLWLEQPKPIRVGVLARLRILDQSISIEEVGAETRRLLFWVSLPEPQLVLFEAQLRSWWHEVAIDLLLKRRPPVTAFQVRAQAERLRDGFTSRSLPRTVGRPVAEEARRIVNLHSGEVFVQQLGWIEVPTRLLERAIIDFWRTVEQATVWVSNHLIELAELQEYRENLAEQWDHAWDAMLRGLPDGATDKQKSDAGYSLWTQMRDRTDPYLRADYGESFFRSGVLYELANSDASGQCYGWHPEFEAMLRMLTVERVP